MAAAVLQQVPLTVDPQDALLALFASYAARVDVGVDNPVPDAWHALSRV